MQLSICFQILIDIKSGPGLDGVKSLRPKKNKNKTFSGLGPIQILSRQNMLPTKIKVDFYHINCLKVMLLISGHGMNIWSLFGNS